MNETSEKFAVKIPWGIFGPNGYWRPNPALKMPEAQQFTENLRNGLFSMLSKPRLRRYPGGQWCCEGAMERAGCIARAVGFGGTALSAYQDWRRNIALAH